MTQGPPFTNPSGAIHTTERLARALEEHGAPRWMVDRARAGGYDDYLSDSATPEVDLYTHARQLGLTAIAEGVLRGEWDATKEESDAWAASPDGRETFRLLLDRPAGDPRGTRPDPAAEPKPSATRGAARKKGKRR